MENALRAEGKTEAGPQCPACGFNLHQPAHWGHRYPPGGRQLTDCLTAWSTSSGVIRTTERPKIPPWSRQSSLSQPPRDQEDLRRFIANNGSPLRFSNTVAGSASLTGFLRPCELVPNWPRPPRSEGRKTPCLYGQSRRSQLPDEAWLLSGHVGPVADMGDARLCRHLGRASQVATKRASNTADTTAKMTLPPTGPLPMMAETMNTMVLNARYVISPRTM